MKLNHLTDKQLLIDTASIAKTIRISTLDLLNYLTEVARRKLFCDLGYSSLFTYIVDELKFSDSQAAIYSNIVKSKVIELAPVQVMVEDGEVSLFALSVAAKEIVQDKVQNSEEKLTIINNIKTKSKAELKNLSQRENNKSTSTTLKLDHKLIEKLEKIKKKLGLNLELAELIDYLADEKLGVEVEKETKTITPKLKRHLIHKAKHQCEYKTKDGKQCTETKYLEIDHIHMKSMGGGNNKSNLRVLCRNHNQRASMNQIHKNNFAGQSKNSKLKGQHSIDKILLSSPSV